MNVVCTLIYCILALKIKHLRSVSVYLNIAKNVPHVFIQIK